MARRFVAPAVCSVAAVPRLSSSTRCLHFGPHLFFHGLMSDRIGGIEPYFHQFSLMLVARDLAASEAFYVRLFGFEVVESMNGMRRLRRPGVSLYLISESPPTPDKPDVTLAPPSLTDRTPVNLVFHVSDVRAVHAALSVQGLSFLAPPQQPPWGGWRCFARDPDGYLIEIEQAESA